jgi:hypothetical protein
MAKNDARRQQKLMKKRRKDKARKKKQAELAAVMLMSPKSRIRHAREYPLYECLINPAWQENGLATILVSRQQNNDELVYGFYLVDVLCLGLKNTFCDANCSLFYYDQEVLGNVFDEPPGECSPAMAHHIIHGAIAFARRFGFEPHRDFALSHHVLDPPGYWEPCEDVEFGRDGKPFYIAGPHDNTERIIAKLQRAAGDGNYDVLAEA